MDAGAKVGDNSVIGQNSRLFQNAVVGCFANPSLTPTGLGAALGARFGQSVQVQTGAVVPINAKTAHALGMKIPQAILLRTDRVIQ